ncbi:MAG TPA: universal stress protein, partial [Mycobacteriales bacterium]|nr:universal stress protein [Mycobacteriales bacterium]
MTETATRIETGLYSEVLLPVDFTSLGWQVLATAERLAEGFGAPLRLLHVDTASPWSDAEPGLLQLNARSLGRTVRVQVAPDRDVALGLGRAIAGRDALVVMGAHARTGAADI